MAVSAPTRRRTRQTIEAATQIAPRAVPSPSVERGAPVDLETLSAGWQHAFDVADAALRTATDLPRTELAQRSAGLQRERAQTARLLRHVAHVAGSHVDPWLSPVPITNAMLGVPGSVRACLFDVEGVLTDSAALHAWAWGEVFDDFLRRLSEKTDWHFIPFDRVGDYRAYVDGRSRLEGVHAFLDSRGIHVPDGRADDEVDADTAQGLAKRKGATLERRLRERAVLALPGARRYLEAARRAGLKRAVISASASTSPMLERAGLAPLIDERVDAAVIREEGLRSRPAPDLLLAACRRLDVAPARAVTLTHSAAGVAAGRTAGLTVIGVAESDQAELLEGFGAQRVVPTLSALLDLRFVETDNA